MKGAVMPVKYKSVDSHAKAKKAKTGGMKPSAYPPKKKSK